MAMAGHGVLRFDTMTQHGTDDKAHYQAYLYDGSPAPPLSPEDKAWARQFVPPRS